jgi:glutamate synthase (NADPH/NADH) large chain
MNRIKGASCSGEGGEDADRFKIMDSGDSANSRVKQIASARFGVTVNYLNNCNEIEIKWLKVQNQEKVVSYQVLK